MNHLTLAPEATRGAAGLPEPARMPLSRVAGFLVALMAATMLLANCGGKQVAVPGVVGLQLDDAHHVLAAKGFEEFEDLDLFDNRSIMLDANWVVLQQDPKPNAQTGEGDKVTLRVGKIGEIRTRKALPAGSPVLARLVAQEKKAAEDRARKAAEDAKRAAQQKAKAAAEQKKQSAARVAAAAQYVNGIDPAVRLAVKNHRELVKLRNQVRDGQIGGDALIANVSTATSTLDMLRTILEAAEPSDEAKLDQQHQELLSAVDGFKRAAFTLFSADGSGSASALRRFDVVYADAAGHWDAALRSSYSAGRVAGPPLLR